MCHRCSVHGRHKIMSMEADSTGDNMPEDSTESNDHHVRECCLMDACEEGQPTLQTPLCKEGNVKSSVPCSLKHNLHGDSTSHLECESVWVEQKNTAQNLRDKKPATDAAFTKQTTTKGTGHLTTIQTPFTGSCTGKGMKQSDKDAVTHHDSKIPVHPSKGFRKQRTEGDDLYSEIIASTTKVRIFKKYFGDSRRPGICHPPHPNKNYGSFKCKECYLSFNYLPSLLFHRNTHGKKYHVFECSKCSYKSHIPGAYTQHELRRHPDQLYQCHSCNITFLQKSTLTRHKVVCHVDQQAPGCVQKQPLTFVCNLCTAVFYTKLNMTNHLECQHMIADVNGSKSGNSQSANCKQVYFHVISVQKAAPNKQFKIIDSVECKECKQVFPGKGMDFIQHRQTVDISTASIKMCCQWCSYVGPSACKLACHKYKVHFCCLICNYKHANKELLKHHMQYCQQGITKQKRISQSQRKELPHLSLHEQSNPSHPCITSSSSDHHPKPEIQLPPSVSGTDVVQHWYCMTCNVIFPTKRLLDLHIKLNHRPMKKVDTSQEESEQQPGKDREWRCLLCNTLHQTFQECDKHQILHHPDEYEYCPRSEIAEPTLPLIMSALAEKGPPYTCNMCDCRTKSIEELHKHKEQFHKVAYSISISDKLCANKRNYQCRYRCGYTDDIHKNVLKHEPSCKQKTLYKPSIFSQPSIVLDSSSGKLVNENPSACGQDECKEQCEETVGEKPLHSNKLNCPEEMQPDGNKSVLNTAASADKLKSVHSSECNRQSIMEQQRDGFLKDIQPEPQVIQQVPILKHSCQPQSPQQPVKTLPTANVQAFVPVKWCAEKDEKKSKDDLHRSKLPVYGKSYRASSSDDESNCRLLDKSSDSEDSPTSESVSTESTTSEDENLLEKNRNHPSVQKSDPDDQSAAAHHPTAQLTKDKPVVSPPKMCPPLLQPAVLMRFFQAIDMSDLYRLALQMITGSPQPHALPMSDPAMTNSSTVHFKYKIPLGYSHSEFQEMPLFPSSKEVLKLDNMQTLPSSIISKHYKGVLAKPFHKHFSSLVDSAIIAQFKDSTLKNIDRFVRKQRIDDRKDITLSLSQYIVSQYFKNQQKKIQNKHFHSSFGVNLASTGNSPGAGPSCTQKQPAPIRLLISPSALQGTSAPVTTVKFLPKSINSPHIQANMTRNLINVSSEKVCFVNNAEAPTPAVVLSTSNATPGMSSNADTVEKNCMESSIKLVASATNCKDFERKDAKDINSELEMSFQSTKINKKQVKDYNMPLRRSARLHRSSDKQELVAAESIPAVTRLIPNKVKNMSMHKLVKDKEEPMAKRSKISIKGTIDNCHDRDCQKNYRDRSTEKTFSLTRLSRCKEKQSNECDNNQSDHHSLETKSELSKKVWPLSIENTAASQSESSEHSNKELDCTTEVQTLHMVQEPSIPDINIDSKHHVFHDSLVSNTTDGDGVLETRMSRRPLHGLNGSVMQMHGTTSVGSNCIIRQVSLNGKICKTQAASVSFEKMEMPDQNKLIAELPRKADEQNIATERPGHDPVKHMDHPSVKNGGMVSAVGRSDELNTSGLTYSMQNCQPCKEQLPHSIPANNVNDSTAQTWKKTVNKHEVLAVMAKRRTWRCAPYKSLTYTNVNTDVREKNLGNLNTTNNFLSQIHSKNKDTVDIQDQSPEKYDCILTDVKKISNEDEGTSCLVLTKSDVSHHLGGPKEPQSELDQKYCEVNRSYTREEVMCKQSHACPKTKGQLKLINVDLTCSSECGEAETIVQHESLLAPKKLSSKVCDIKESYKSSYNEGNCTRRSLRNKQNKMETDVSNDNKRMQTEKSVDHSYIKTRRSNSNCKTKRTRLVSCHMKRQKKLKASKVDGEGKTDVGRLIVPHDHSYTGNKQQRNTTQTKGTDKMDHCYYWKIDSKEQDGLCSEICAHESEPRKKEGSNCTSGRQTISKDCRDSAIKEHKRTRLNDHSYSTTFPKQVLEQMAAMDHCYIKLTPINIDSNPKGQGSGEHPFVITNPSTVRKNKRAGSPISNIDCQRKFSKHKLGHSWTSMSSRRELRPRSIQSSYYK